MNDFEEDVTMNDNVIFSSEAGRQAYRDDEFDWFEDVCNIYEAEPELYED